MFAYLRKRRVRKNLETVLQDLSAIAAPPTLNWRSPFVLVLAIRAFLNVYLVTRQRSIEGLSEHQLVFLLVVAIQLADSWSRELDESFDLTAVGVGGLISTTWCARLAPASSYEGVGEAGALLFQRARWERDCLLADPALRSDSGDPAMLTFSVRVLGGAAQSFLQCPTNKGLTQLMSLIDCNVVMGDDMAALRGLPPDERDARVPLYYYRAMAHLKSFN